MSVKERYRPLTGPEGLCSIRVHEKARCDQEEDRREGGGKDEERQRQGRQAGGEGGGPDRPGHVVHAPAPQGRRLAALPLPAAVALRRPAPAGSLLQLLCLLVTLVAVASPPVAAEERPLRLVTLNLLHGGPWSSFTGDDQQLEARLGLIVPSLRALEPDIVALQESPVTRRRGDVAARLAEALGLSHVHARATERLVPFRLLGRLIVGVLGFVEGPAVLSRFPIVASAIHDLPRCRRWLDPRVALQVDVRTAAGDLAVFSTHTSRDDCQTRRVAELAAARDVPAVVMGDLNTPETNLEVFREHGLVDCFRAVRPDVPGLTVWQRIDAPAPTVQRRVDYVFARDGRAVRARAVSARIVLDAPERREDGRVLWPSDHYGLLIELRLIRRA
jgi:endonuclease/exonuclease/phosphatase family metal-dependent hydrolase